MASQNPEFSPRKSRLTDGDLILYCQRLGLSDVAKDIIVQVRQSEPARLVGGGRQNVPCAFPSRKMGCIIQAESHTVELAVLFLMEHGPSFLEFYDQPPAIKLNYLDSEGRSRGHWHTADYFVLEESWVGWEEVKPADKLARIAEASPNRYVKEADGTWRCPPGEQYAQHFGLGYRVRVAESVGETLRRNFVFLDDYYRANRPLVSTESAGIVLRCVESHPSLSLADLYGRVEADGVGLDDVNALIAQGRIYVDLEAEALIEPTRVRVFRDAEIARSFAFVAKTSPSAALDWAVSKPLVALPGHTLLYDGRPMAIIAIGQTRMCLKSEDGSISEIALADFERLLQEGRLTAMVPDGEDVKRRQNETSAQVQERLAKASAEDIARANRRYIAIEPYLDRELPENLQLPRGSATSRSLRNWKAAYREALHTWNCGYIGLLPSQEKPGNYEEKMPVAVREAMDKAIVEDFETIKNKKANTVYNALVLRCIELRITPPSKTTFYEAIKKRSKYEQVRARQGPRAAYQHEAFYFRLSESVPRHGDRPFEIAHIDHTELDVELVCSRTGNNLGRPWLTLMMDAYSRRILALYLTYDPPSYRSCMMVLRTCVRQHGRLPQNIVVDGGKEFRSIYFQMLLGVYEITRKSRPKAKARFGAVLERMFGVANTQFIHNLAGNTQLTKNVRQVTKSVNPKNHAVWTLEALYAELCRYCYEVYDSIEHRALGQSPREAFAHGMMAGGERRHRFIAYDDAFRVLTLPTTSKGTAMVVPRCGVKINYFYYTAPELLDPLVENKQVAVRYDPFDLSRAYAFIKGRAGTARWVQCQSMHWGLLQGRTERELMVAAEEMRRRNKRHTQNQMFTAKRLAEFLASAEMHEKTLVQRLQDLAAKNLIADIDHRELGLPGCSPDSAMLLPSPDAAVPKSLAAQSSKPADSPAPAVWGKAVNLEELEVY